MRSNVDVALILCSALMLISISQAAVPTDRNELLQIYSRCTNSDPEFVVDESLDRFTSALEWLEDNEPPKAGVLALTGPPTGLGWSFNLYKGVVALQNCFGASWSFNDSVPLEHAMEAIDLMVADGVKFIFIGALEYIPEIVPEASTKYPTVGFVTPFFDPVLAGLPGTKAVDSRYTDATYIGGYLSQLMSPNDAVIYITTVPFFVEYQVVNSHYYGMLDAAAAHGQPVKELYVKWSTDYVIYDLNAGALESIYQDFPNTAESFVSMSSAIYDIHRELQDKGILSTTGSSDLGPFVGNQLLSGSTSKFEVIMVDAYSYFTFSGNAEGWGELTPFTLTSNMYTGGISEGTLPPIIPDEILEEINQIKFDTQRFPTGLTDLWCGDRVARLLPEGESLDNMTNCLTFNQLFAMNTLDPDIINMGVYSISIEDINTSTTTKIGMSIIIGLVIVMTLVSMVFVAIFRDRAVIKYTSANLSFILLLFALIAEIGLILYIPDVNSHLCKAYFALYTFGLFGALSILLCKMYGFMVMDIRSRKLKMNPVMLKNIIWVFFVTYVLAIGLIIAYMALSPGSEILTDADTPELDKYQTMEICEYSTASEIMAWIIVGTGLVMFALVFAVSFYLSKSSVGVWQAELRYAYMTSVIVIMCTAIGIVGVLAIQDNQFALQWVIYLCGTGIIASIVLTFFGPKVWTLIFERDSPEAGPWKEYNRASGSSAAGASSAVTASRSGTHTPRSNSHVQGSPSATNVSTDTNA
jgi:7TM sweet-taste receptor of 3 GCPR